MPTAFDIAINNGRVIDPETGLDATRHLGIKDGIISAVSTTPLTGNTTIDASDLVVSPGFIDLHSHTPTPLGQYYQLFDGVTTALELEAGSYPVQDFAREISEQPLINFGTSAGYISIRVLEKNGIIATSRGGMPEIHGLRGWVTLAKLVLQNQQQALAKSFTEPASPDERQRIRALLEQSLEDGALGIGLALDYISEAVNSHELAMIFDVAAQHDVPIFIHIRRGINGDPSGLREVLALAGETGTSIHICHITHNAIKNIDLFLAEIAQAQ